MSGIVGVVQLDAQPVDPDRFSRMLSRLAHRGPDDRGSWLYRNIGLGHQLLRTTPESFHERMPLHDTVNQVVITADARLDNRDELIRALGLRAEDTGAIPDGRVLLAAYLAWGPACVDSLLGDFAFAVWDVRRETLFCARDHFGCKPFCYYYRPGEFFAFASEIKSLLCFDQVPGRRNERRIADLLAGVLEDSEATFYQDILRLPPAHTLTVSRSGIELRRYWALDPARELRPDSDQAYAEAFRDIFAEAVRCRIRRVGPLAASLSGGMDSSSIVCMAGHLNAGNGHEPLHTFSELWQGYPEGEELPFINAVVEKTRAVSHLVAGDQIKPLEHIEEIVKHLEQPANNVFSSVGWERRRRISESGVRVVLDGTGGDVTVFYDFNYLAELARSGRWMTLWREASGLSSRYFRGTRSRWGVLGQFALAPLVPEGLRSLERRVRQWRDPHAAADIDVPLQPRFMKRIGIEARLEDLRLRRAAPRSIRQRHIDGFDAMIPYSMELIDKGNAAFGFERRCPFMDKRLAEFCVALPREQRVCQGMTRVIVRRGLQGLLPEAVAMRGTKGDASRNFARALVTFEQQRIEKLLFRSEPASAAYVDIAALRQIYDRLLNQRIVGDAHTVWAVADLEFWLRSAGANA